MGAGARHRSGPALALLVAVLLAAEATARVSVTERITWDSALLPELHLILESGFEQDLDLIVQFGGWGVPTEGPKVECAEELGKAKEAKDGPGSVRRAISFHTRAVLPAGSWLHRSVAFPADWFALPCTVPYRVLAADSGKAIALGVFEVERPPYPVTHPAADPSQIHHDSLVEKWESGSAILANGRHYVVRLRLHNLGERTRIAITDRSIRCERGSSARWVLAGAPLVGESFGPSRLEPGDQHVFVLGVEATQGEISECSAEIELSATSFRIGYSPLKRVEVPLEPRGYYDGR